MVSLRSVALLDRGELLAKWKDHSRVVEEELRACTVEAKNAHEFLLQCTHLFPHLRVKRV